MKPNGALSLIYSVFLGLAVIAFVAIGLATALPRPSDFEFDTGRLSAWYLQTSLILLGCAVALLVGSLAVSRRQPVIANGLLLGGVFTMLYALGMSLASEATWPRVAVAGIALVVTVGVGWARFGRQHAPAPGLTASADVAALTSRIDALESKLDSLGAPLAG